MEIPVMEYMAAALRGDVAELARLSFDCIMCGLCTSRCPAEICQYNVAILGRRLNGRHVAPRAAHVAEMVARVEAGRYAEGLEALMAAETQTLKRLYTEREVEPQGSDDSWVPADTSNL
jgi:ferredoxin